MARYVLRFGGDDRVLETALKNVGKIALDGGGSAAALKWISRHPEAKSVARLVLDCMGKVSMADGHLHKEEMEWTDLSAAYLNKIAV
jgi:tellurite resistance protein